MIDSMRLNCSIISTFVGQSSVSSEVSSGVSLVFVTGTGTITILGGSISVNSTLSSHLLSTGIAPMQLALAPASNTSFSFSPSLDSRSVQCSGNTKFKEASMFPRRSATLSMTMTDMPGLTGSIVSAWGKSSSAGIFRPSSFAVISRRLPRPVSMKARTTVLLLRTKVRLLFQFWTPWVTSKRTTCARGGRALLNLGGTKCSSG